MFRSSPAFNYESCDNRDKFYRHVSKGGWPFSTSAHGWPISDCTGEGLKGVLALMDSPVVLNAVEKGVLQRIEPSRLYDAVNVILTLQNEDGGEFFYQFQSRNQASLAHPGVHFFFFLCAD